MKPGVFTQLLTHLVFAVKYRDRLLKKEIREEYIEFLKKFKIEYDERYLFDFFE